MNAFFRHLLFLLPVLLITQCEKEPGPNDSVRIPDCNFLQALIDIGVDTDGDGKISFAEAERITCMDIVGDCPEGEIESLAGIEAFIHLDTLRCDLNQLSELDLSDNTALTCLTCGGNELTRLDLSNNSALEFLVCPRNELSSLDLSENTALIGLYCSRNPIGSLDLSKNPALTLLWCSFSQLTSLDVSNNTELIDLACGNNLLSTLDVSTNITLEFLACFSNKLSTLDVSNNTALVDLDCSANQLFTLDLSNNILLGPPPGCSECQGWGIHLREMPTLFEVCVWTMPFPPEGVPADTTGSPNVHFTTECSQ